MKGVEITTAIALGVFAIATALILTWPYYGGLLTTEHAPAWVGLLSGLVPVCVAIYVPWKISSDNARRQFAWQRRQELKVAQALLQLYGSAMMNAAFARGPAIYARIKPTFDFVAELSLISQELRSFPIKDLPDVRWIRSTFYFRNGLELFIKRLANLYLLIDEEEPFPDNLIEYEIPEAVRQMHDEWIAMTRSQDLLLADLGEDLPSGVLLPIEDPQINP